MSYLYGEARQSRRIARSIGLGGTIAVHIGVIIAIQFRWSVFFEPPSSPETLILVEISEQIEEGEQPKPVEPVEIETPPDLPPHLPPSQAPATIAMPPMAIVPTTISVTVEEMPEPLMPDLSETAPEVPMPVESPLAEAKEPAQPAPIAARGDEVVNWEAQVLARLNMFKRYPRQAYARKIEGTPHVLIRIDQNGRVLSSKLEVRSGDVHLDREAAGLARRAQPLPSPPEFMIESAGVIEISVPIEFFIR